MDMLTTAIAVTTLSVLEGSVAKQLLGAVLLSHLERRLKAKPKKRGSRIPSPL